MTSAMAIPVHRRHLAELLAEPLPLLFAMVLAWDILFVGNFEVGTLTVAPETIALAGLFAYSMLRATLHRPSRQQLARRALPLLKVFGAFWGCIGLVWLLHGGGAAEAGEFLRVPVYLLYALSACCLCSTSHDVLVAVRGIVAAGLLLCAAVALRGLPTVDMQGGDFRWDLINPMAHAVALAAAVVYAMPAAGRHRTLPHWSLLAVLIAVPLYARSRGAVVACIAGCGVVWWQSSRPTVRASWALLYLLAFSGSCLLIASGLLEEVLIRSGLFEQSGTSNYFRWQIVVLAARMFMADPLAGGGFGSMSNPGPGMLDGLISLPRTNIVTTDNDYARCAAETGSIGLLAIFLLGRRLWQARGLAIATTSGRQSLLPAVGSAIFAFVFALATFEHVFSDPTGWLLIGLAWACFVVK